jgi:DeoR family fructose operon transcriptional repressor
MEQSDILTGIARRQNMIEYLEINHEASVKELAELYDVSVMTIRRDFHYLEDIGIIDLHYGGARIRKERILLPSFNKRDHQENPLKRSIGKAAAGYIKDGDSIFMDVSTTVFYILRYLQDVHLTVITNSIHVMECLYQNPKIRLLIAPGIYNPDTAGTCDLSTIDYIRKFHVDKAFIGAMACSPKFGVCSSNEIEGALKNQMQKNADESFLLVDHTKFRTSGPVIHNALSDYDYILTDSQLDSEMEKTVRKINRNIRICTEII